MIPGATTEVDRFPDRLVERVLAWAVIAWVAASGAAWAVGASAAAGVALGGAVSLGSLLCYRTWVNAWLRPRRRAKVALWLLSLVKWPLLVGLFYVAIKQGWAQPGWLCVGVSLVPAVTVGLALRALLLDHWRRLRAAGAGT
jgi:hypothetical protein